MKFFVLVFAFSSLLAQANSTPLLSVEYSPDIYAAERPAGLVSIEFHYSPPPPHSGGTIDAQLVLKFKDFATRTYELSGRTALRLVQIAGELKYTKIISVSIPKQDCEAPGKHDLLFQDAEGKMQTALSVASPCIGSFLRPEREEAYAYIVGTREVLDALANEKLSQH